MITPIQNINLYIRKAKTYSKSPQNTSLNYPENYKSIYSKNINFRGYFQSTELPGFQQTVDENYFQLPQVKLKNGSMYQLKPDKYQLECSKRLYAGDSVVFCAPTGTGKTAVAHYAITLNLKNGKKTIYTVPQKALANDKYREFKTIYGKENVGILTGDIKFNTTAPIQIMTTEIYNNQTADLKQNSKNIGTVIFDEAHNISDQDRGKIWEYSIIKTPLDKTQILCLSATIGNSTTFANWIQSLNSERNVAKIEIKPEERFVPLIWHLYQQEKGADAQKGKLIKVKRSMINLESIDPKHLTNRQKRALEVIFKTKNEKDNYYEMTQEEYIQTAQELKQAAEGLKKCSESTFTEFLDTIYPNFTPEQKESIIQFLSEIGSEHINKIKLKDTEDNYPALVKDLEIKNMLPAIIFKLSKRKCSQTAYSLLNAELDLTTKEEKEKIKAAIEEYKKKGIYLGKSFNEKMLLSGFAFHHSGVTPQYKKLIEDLFSKKLLKVVVATSTLSTGINMPAKTVVLSDITYQKYNAATKKVEYETISANEFHQMTGRAGRRGIDSLGHVVFYNLKPSIEDTKKVKSKKKSSDKKSQESKRPDELETAYNYIISHPDKLRSFFEPDWQILAQYFEDNSSLENIKQLIEKSFSVYISKEPEKTKRTLYNQFVNYQNVMLKHEYIIKNNQGEISLTPKGKILKLCQGLNPIMLSSLIYEEKFSGLNAAQLCQMVGYIAGSSPQKEKEEMEEIISQKFASQLQDEASYFEQKFDFEKIREAYKKLESKVIKSFYESKLKPEDIVISDSFSGLVAYLWAHLNEISDNSTDNFRQLITNLQDTQNTDFKSKEYSRKSYEGNIYKILTNTITVLKQINNICDFALKHPEIYPNQNYYRKLKENVQDALLLSEKDSIGSEIFL